MLIFPSNTFKGKLFGTYFGTEYENTSPTTGYYTDIVANTQIIQERFGSKLPPSLNIRELVNSLTSAKLNKSDDGIGVAFENHSLGLMVVEIDDEPGQPDLYLGSVIYSIGGECLMGLDEETQLSIFIREHLEENRLLVIPQKLCEKFDKLYQDYLDMLEQLEKEQAERTEMNRLMALTTGAGFQPDTNRPKKVVSSTYDAADRKTQKYNCKQKLKKSQPGNQNAATQAFLKKYYGK